MATYNGFSTINANKPRSTDLTPGTGGGYGSTTQAVIPGKKFKLTKKKKKWTNTCFSRMTTWE